MVFAFIIQTLDHEESELAYYRFYSTWLKHSDQSFAEDNEFITRPILFESSIDKKDLLYFVIKKVHMLYSLKLKQSLIPIQSQDRKTLIKGSYLERSWKSEVFSVVWEGVPGVGFSLICDQNENLVQAQNILDLIVFQLDKYLQLVSYPSIATKTIDSIALILDQMLPNGQLLFLNSSIVKCYEKQLELDLQG